MYTEQMYKILTYNKKLIQILSISEKLESFVAFDLDSHN